MKDLKSVQRRESETFDRKAAERPDNGSRSSKGCGPSSGAYRDNPHKRTKLTRHAWL